MTATPAPGNRVELADRLDDLCRQGMLDDAEAARLLQHFDALSRDMAGEKAALEPEYHRRLAENGKDAADAWLDATARDFGRRQGEATRAITEQLRVVTG